MGVGSLSREEASLAYLRDAAGHDRSGLADAILGRVQRVRPVLPPAHVLEVGVGTGWLLAALAERGYTCAGIELNPWCREYALAMLHDRGARADITEGSIEEADLAESTYDLVLAESVLEHVPDYARALEKIYRSLKPGGVLYFSSTNKLSFLSGEYRGFPLYGWLPQRLRLLVRRLARDQVIADNAHFDWNQFTYWGLRRALRQAGFSGVYDRFDLLDPSEKTGWKRLLIIGYKRWPPLKWPLLIFDFNTGFCCVK
jgi:2-polyprenyl-6-hydroxyphenyl methylase/3-demethylubiquinone-9 3-methyltransferase